MNKRQRKKAMKRTMQRMTDFLRGALKHKIGDPLTPTALHEISNIIGDTIKAKLAQPSFASQIFLVTPIVRPPYRQWMALGREQLTHHIGINTRNGVDYWMRFCDYQDADREFILSYEKVVDCLQCIAREGEVNANANQ